VSDASDENKAQIMPLDRPGKTERYAELHGLRVLVVDDDPGTLAAVADVLMLSGAAVRGAASANEARAVLETFAAQVIVCDISMPDEDGYSFIRKLRARGRAFGGDVPALALTALASCDDRSRAFAAGYHDHIAKPVDIDRLRVAIVRLSASRKRG
jgi:two-component system CheB/CheR fusion protein